MSNSVSLFSNNNLPVTPDYLRGHVSSTALALKSTAEGNRISIRGRAWRLIQDGSEVAASGNPDMDLVIVAALPDISRLYYDKAYQDGSNDAPTCWSTNGVTPDPGVAVPKSTACASCPMNQPGSGTRDQSRACRFTKRIAVALPAELARATPDNPARAYLMSIPATSLFGDKVPDDQPKTLIQYGNFLAARNADITTLVTRFSFDIQQTQPTIRFQAVRYLTQEEFAAVCALMRDPDTQAILPMSFTSPAPQVAPQAPPVQEAGFQPVTPQAPQVAPQTPPVQEAGFQPVAPQTPQVAPQAPPMQEAGFQPTAPQASRTMEPVMAEPKVVSAGDVAKVAGVSQNSVADILNKWGA